MPRIAVVCVHYYPRWARASLDELARVQAECGAEHCVLVNNNARLHDELLGLAARHRFVSAVARHDNGGHEFGAYQLGLDRLRAAGDFDWVLFVNDTFATHQPFCSRHRRMLADALADPAGGRLPMAVGRVDALPRSYAIEGARAHRWITTSLFALNRKAIAVLGGRVHHPELDHLVSGLPDIERFFSPDLDETLVKHLKAWLFGALPGPRWRCAAPLGADNAARLAAKARAILQEKYLSALLEEGRCFFLDLRKMNDIGRVVCRGERLVFDVKQWLRGSRAAPTP